MQPSTIQYAQHETLFDELDADFTEAYEIEAAENAAKQALQLGSLAICFAGVERVPRYSEETRENDAEHSFMLSLVASELAAQYYPALDIGLVSQFGTVHDLIEIETGDIATFTLDDASISAKEQLEHAALHRLLTKLPVHTRQLLQRYELQHEPEAQFVRLVDKILPVIVDIVGPGKKVMAEDYGITTSAGLAANETRLSGKLRERFPYPELSFIHLVRDILAVDFDIAFNRS